MRMSEAIQSPRRDWVYCSEVGRIILEMTKRKRNHSGYFSSNFSIKENYLQTGKHGMNMVKKEQRVKINEEIVREHLATFNDLKCGEGPKSHIPDY